MLMLMLLLLLPLLLMLLSCNQFFWNLICGVRSVQRMPGLTD